MNNQNYTKKYLRQVFQQKRNELSTEEIEEKSKKIFNHFFSLIVVEKTSVGHIFLPISKKKEVDTFIVLREIWEKYPQITTLTSIMNWENQSLTHIKITKNSTFVENQWKILEPMIENENDIYSPEKIDWVIIPLLAFDEKGYRVGYGKGFYDKFLATCNDKILKIGVSFFPAIHRIEDINNFDVQVDCCITPNEIFNFFVR